MAMNSNFNSTTLSKFALVLINISLLLYFANYSTIRINRNVMENKVIVNGLDLSSEQIELSNVSKEFEDMLKTITHLRRSQTAVQEIFNYLAINLNKTINTVMNETIFNTIIAEISDRKNVVQLEVQKASESLQLNTFKYNRLKQISDYIRSKIIRLQNPSKHLCNTTEKLICKLNIGAGFAAEMHSILWCLISAFYTNQTVILIPEWDLYFGNGTEWEDVFQPLSNTCDYKTLPEEQLRERDNSNTVFKRKLINYLPKNIGAELMAHLDNPNSWFHSQFIAYIMRPTKRLKDYIENIKLKYEYRHPIVGIHVRRSDKLSYNEALHHSVAEYMLYVDDYFDRLDLQSNVLSDRQVFVATDDQTVLPQLRNEYPNYRFIGSTSAARNAANSGTKYSNESLWEVLVDVFLLAETDYIVCTFSSGICRLSYELMQFKRMDASLMYRSLDVPFHYHHSLTPVRTALYTHLAKSSEQWNLTIGAQLHERVFRNSSHNYGKTEWFSQAVNGRGWDSYFYACDSIGGTSYKLYPTYKVYEDIRLV